MKFQAHDKVRLTEDHQVLHLVEIFKAGETGTLTKLYRIQDGEEIWQMVLDRSTFTFLAVPHTKLEKVEVKS